MAYYKILKIVVLKDNNIIQNYLSNRKFKGRLSNNLSEEFEQEAGVSQGGILSCLFLKLIVLLTV